ncbi:MAG TPA: hypothetical protein VFM93_01395 [Candidatus Limnocylindria bacterium]|nr:hypothetical protein [Candidatus Limnocylindria bacterium]
MSVLRIVIAAAAAMTLAASHADASCVEETLRERIARADVVAHGAVVGLEGGDRRSLIVQVDRTYKGTAPAVIFVAAGPRGEGGALTGVATSVDYDAPVGSEHTLFLKQHSPAGFSTDACSGSHPGGPSAEERAALGEGRAADRPTATTELRAGAIAALGISLALTFVAFRRWAPAA